jgi:CheY-like chemotaxis protein
MTFYIEPVILVVDDDASQLVVVKAFLEKAGQRVMTASSGATALDIARSLEEPLKLLVTDLEMPGMTGRVLADELRKTQPDLRILYLTAHSDQLFGKSSSLLGSDEAFLEKPVTAAALSEAVRLLLRRVADQPENFP